MRITDRTAIAHVGGPSRGETGHVHRRYDARTRPAAPPRLRGGGTTPCSRHWSRAALVQGTVCRVARAPPSRRPGQPCWWARGRTARECVASSGAAGARFSFPRNEDSVWPPGSTAAALRSDLSLRLRSVSSVSWRPRARGSNRWKGSLAPSATRRVRGGGRTAAIRLAPGVRFRCAPGVRFRCAAGVCFRCPLPGSASGASLVLARARLADAPVR